MKRFYTVRGRWPFPTDMLRHDQAAAATSADHDLIAKMSHEISDSCSDMNEVNVTLEMERGTVSRYFPHGRNRPNYARWESFGWRVIDDPDLMDSIAFRQAHTRPVDAPIVRDGPVCHTELIGALMIARKALTGTERKDSAVAVIDAVTGYTDHDGNTVYPRPLIEIFRLLLAKVKAEHFNSDEVRALIRSAEAALNHQTVATEA